MGTAVWSGDKVRRDEDGLLYFIGRDDLMIKSSGNRISPSEIEEVAIGHELVAEAVATGIPDQRLGHRIKLFVRMSSGEDDPMVVEEALIKSLKRDLPNFMHPHDIVVMKEFPKNPNGKLDRNALAKV